MYMMSKLIIKYSIQNDHIVVCGKAQRLVFK